MNTNRESIRPNKKASKKALVWTRRIFGLIAAAFVITIIVSITVSYFCLKVTDYTVKLDGITRDAKIVCITDLHSKEFGRGNSRLLAKIKAQKPDAIFADGDLISSDAEDEDVTKMLTLLRKLQEIAPVYYSIGNHEQRYMERTQDDLLSKVKETGVTVLNDNCETIDLGGNEVCIGGTIGHAFLFGRSEKEFEASPEYIMLKKMESSGRPTIVLAHMPDTFIFNYAYDNWDIDLVVSGHTHGGLIRIPFKGGLYAPMQGFFPDYDEGWFRLGDHMQIVISAGMAGYEWVPRINNIPEIVVITLVPDDGT